MEVNGKVNFTERQSMNPRKEILFDGHFYDVTEFAKIHPGGGVINYYTQRGEDSTIAIKQLHKRSMAKVRLLMSSLKKRPASESESTSRIVAMLKNIKNFPYFQLA